MNSSRSNNLACLLDFSLGFLKHAVSSDVTTIPEKMQECIESS